MRYTVSNHTGRSRFFYPRVVMTTDSGQIIKSGKRVSHALFRKIKRLFRDPYMEDQHMLIGRLLQGKSNAKDGVAIFARVDKKVRDFSIYFTGLSGDTAVQTDPLTHKHIVLRKTLKLKYHVPGQAIGIAPHVEFDGKSWVMR
jgi:hypothetical protein